MVAFGQPSPAGDGGGLFGGAQVAAQLRADQEAVAKASAEAESARAWEELFGKWREEHLMTLDDLFAMEPPEPLIDGNILYTGTNAWIAGPSGEYKTFFAFDWACCVATGTPWLGREVLQGDVIYLAGEGASGLKERTKAWLEARSVEYADLKKHITFMHMESLVDMETKLFLVEELTRRNRILFVIDTQARATPGVNENDKDAMDPFVGFITELAVKHGCTTLTVHHSTKTGSDIMRGSGSIYAAAHTVIGCSKDKDSDEMLAELYISKQKDSRDGYGIRFEMIPTLESLTITNATGAEEVFGIGYNEKPSDQLWRQMAALSAIVESDHIGMTRAEVEREVARKDEVTGKKSHKATRFRAIADLENNLLISLVGGTGEQKRGGRYVSTRLGRERLEAYREAEQD